MAKITLSFEEDYDFLLIAIYSHAKDYRVCWFLNNLLELELERTDDLELKQKNTIGEFPMYLYYKEEDLNEYYLIGNRSETGYLIGEEKKVNFFMQVKGPIRENEKEQLIVKINSLPIVLKAYEIDINQLKSKKNLIF